jgi:hypothetical protein
VQNLGIGGEYAGLVRGRGRWALAGGVVRPLGAGDLTRVDLEALPGGLSSSTTRRRCHNRGRFAERSSGVFVLIGSTRIKTSKIEYA